MSVKVRRRGGEKGLQYQGKTPWELKLQQPAKFWDAQNTILQSFASTAHFNLTAYD